MSMKAGVYFIDSSQTALEQYGDASISSLVNMVVERYKLAMREALPELSNEEWQTLLNVYAGSEMTSYNPPFRIASDMMDDVGAIDLTALDDDYAALVKKMYALNQTEQCAILDFAQRFWGRDWSSFGSFDEIKDAIKGA